MKDERGAVDGHDGREEAVDVTDGLWGLGQHLLVDRPLNLILCDSLDAEGDQIGKGVAANLAVANDGGGTKQGVFGLDVLIHGITEGGVSAFVGGLQLVRLQIGLEFNDLHDELVLVLMREGFELLFTGGVGVCVNFGVPRAAGELLNGRQVDGMFGFFWHGGTSCKFSSKFRVQKSPARGLLI